MMTMKKIDIATIEAARRGWREHDDTLLLVLNRSWITRHAEVDEVHESAGDSFPGWPTIRPKPQTLFVVSVVVISRRQPQGTV